MRRLLFLFIIIFSLTSCTAELKNNLTNIETWEWSNTKTIHGTDIKVTETKEISFRNNTLVDLVISNGEDTLLYKKSNITWNIALLNTINILEEGTKYEKEIDVEGYNRLSLNLIGFSTGDEVYKFTPKYDG